MAPDPEIIVAVAIKFNGMIVSKPRPARHHDVLHPLGEAVSEIIGSDEQGFLTSTGRWVDRIAARNIAVRNMGIKPAHSLHLFSEDLW